MYKNKECILSYINFPILRKFYLAYEKNEVHQNNKVVRFIKKKIENEHIAISTFNTLKIKLYRFLKKTNKLLELLVVMLIITVCFAGKYRCNY